MQDLNGDVLIDSSLVEEVKNAANKTYSQKETIIQRCKEHGIIVNSKNTRNLFRSYVKNNKSELDSILFGNFDRCDAETYIRDGNPNIEYPHTTGAWIISGKLRNKVADIIFSKIVLLDVVCNLSSKYNDSNYLAVSYASLMTKNLPDQISQYRNVWMLYLRDWDNIFSRMTESLIKDRLDVATCGSTHPTIITIRDENIDGSIFKDHFLNKEFGQNVKVIET